MKLKNLACATTGAGALWVVAFALMLWNTFDGADAVAGRWALFVGLAATSATVMIAVKSARRVVLEVMSWEHWMMDSVKKEERERTATVRAIR